jgi:hypothetical protein
MNGFEQLYLIFPLNDKNPILKPLDMSFKPILQRLIILHKLVIGLNNKLQLMILNTKRLIQIPDLTHQALLNITGQLPHILNPLLRLLNQIRPHIYEFVVGRLV